MSFLSRIRRTILLVLQWLWRLRAWRIRVLGRMRWWIRSYILGKKPIGFTKRPKNPAIIASNAEDVAKFAAWCFSNGNDTVVMYDPIELLSRMPDVLRHALERVGLECEEIDIVFQPDRRVQGVPTNINRMQRKILIVDGRKRYTEAIVYGTVTPATETSQMPELLDTPKVDMLVLCGTQELGDFPPLALRACEIYFADMPLSFTDFCLIHEQFARTEQRLGT